MTIRQIINHALQIFSQEWRLLVPVSIDTMIIYWLMNLAPNAAQTPWLGWVTMVLMMPLTLGLYGVYLAVVRKEETSIGRLFRFYGMPGRYGAMVLLMAPTCAGTVVMSLLTALMEMMANNSTVILSLFSVMLIGSILYGWFVLRWSFVVAAWVLNPNQTVKEAFHRGWEAGNGHAGRLLGVTGLVLLLPAILIALVQSMTLGQAVADAAQNALVNAPMYLMMCLVMTVYLLCMAILHWIALRNVRL